MFEIIFKKYYNLYLPHLPDRYREKLVQLETWIRA